MALKTHRFGEEIRGGRERSFGGVTVSITAKDSPLLSNEHESWSISQLKRQQTVMETQQRMGRQRYSACHLLRVAVVHHRGEKVNAAHACQQNQYHTTPLNVMGSVWKKREESESPASEFVKCWLL